MSTLSASWDTSTLQLYIQGSLALALAARAGCNAADDACRRPVTVDVYSIGMFKFKGVMGMYNVVQIMPALLADRNEHIPASLPRGKATCVTRDIEKLSTVTVYLPDYEQPQLHAGHNKSHADTVQTPVGSMTNSPAASLLVPIGIA